MSDSDHPKSPATNLLDKLPGSLLGLLIAGVGWGLTELGRPILDTITRASTPQFLLQVILLLVAALSLIGVYVVHLRSQIKKPLSSKFEFDKFGGFYIERSTGHGVCTKCLSDGIVIHLMDVGGKDSPKMCNACGKAYRGSPKDAA